MMPDKTDKDSDLFTERLVRAQHDLNAFVFSLLPFNPDSVQEVVQETNLALLAARAKYDPARPFMPWALSFAKYQVKAFLRDRNRERILYSSDLIDRIAEVYADSRPQPGQIDEQEDILRHLDICRKRLREPERALLALFYEQRLPVNQMSREVGMKPGSIRVTLCNIRKKLGNCLRSLCQLGDGPKGGGTGRAPLDRIIQTATEDGRPPSRRTFVKAAAELEKLGDGELREFVDQFRIHALLSGCTVRPRAISRRLPSFRQAAVRLAAGLAILLGAAALLFFLRPAGGRGAIGIVARAYCALGADGAPVTAETALRPGEWHWNNGLIQIKMNEGTSLLVEAPVRLRAFDARHILLYSGNVTVKMQKGETGFVIDTPRMKLTDLGTEFGVGVLPDGESQVQVFDGAVLATSNLRPVERTLTEGEGAAADRDGTLRSLPSEPSFFIRRMPKRDFVQPYGGMAFNKPRISSMEALPAARPPVIDGNLGDWPTNLSFRAACEPPYDKTYTAEARVMYDATNLYLAAEVGDPDPLRNRNADNPTYNFAGGSVIFRLATVPGLPDPLPAHLQKNNITSSREINACLASLICWYDAARRASRLTLCIGMDPRFTTTVSLPPGGWKGAFRRHPDGLGYTMEYAIPWSVFGATPPKRGETRANHWNIHWSDSGGRVCIGQLVENARQPSPEVAHLAPFNYCYYLPVWGKLTFK